MLILMLEQILEGNIGAAVAFELFRVKSFIPLRLGRIREIWGSEPRDDASPILVLRHSS